MTIRDLSTHPAKYVTVPDLVRYSGVPRATVYWDIYTGRLPSRRFGRNMLRVETVTAREWIELRGGTPDVSTTHATMTLTPASHTSR